MATPPIPDATWLWANEPCRAACPVRTDAGAYVTAIADGRFEDAYLIARAPNPFPSVCGRVCAAPCERACRRGSIDAPVSIRALKRFVAERFVSDHTNIIGTAVSMNFSTDKAQSCLYVADNANMAIYILNRSNLQELGRFGHSGRAPGEFHWTHQVSLDSKGNVYTAEVDTGKRIQKFLRYGATGCSGTGSTTVGGVIEK